MQWGKSEDQKRAEAAEKERDAARWRADQERLRDEWSRRSYPNTPVGRAEAAMRNGDRFFQLSVAISELNGAASSFGSSSNQLQSTGRAPDLLGQIEELGWRLEHVGYVFIETGSTSTDRLFSTGEGTVTKGQVQGVYLFRSTRAVGPAA